MILPTRADGPQNGLPPVQRRGQPWSMPPSGFRPPGSRSARAGRSAALRSRTLLAGLVRSFGFAAVAGLTLVSPIRADEEGELGLPFTRFYSYEEIGNTSRGMRLGFDPLGRIAVTRAGSCIVLNDTTWLDIAEREGTGIVMQRLVFGPQGDAYYGAFGSWGVVQMHQGRLRPESLVPADAPKWTLNSNFGEILVLPEGACFAGLEGVVHWNSETGRQTYLEIPSLMRIFLIGDRLHATSYVRGICRVDVANRTVETIRPPVAEGAEIDQVAAWDDSRVITANHAGLLRFFDGRVFSPFPGPLGEQALGRVTALTRLPEGKLAVAINGAGVFVVSAEGRILSALTTPDYHRVTDLASRENGVLWIVNEGGIEKILFNSPLTSFGQRQGLPLSWPQLVRWNGRIVVASSGRLYESVGGRAGETTRFRLMPDQPEGSVWAITTHGDRLLVGANTGLYEHDAAGGFTPVMTGFDVARLVRVGDIVYALGSNEITALRLEGDRWVECAPRVPGLGYPFVVHGTDHAVWIELGPNRAARVRLDDGRLRVRLFEDFPWKTPRWINIGWAGGTVAMTGLPDGRVYFDETREALVPRPELGRLIDQAPFLVNRFRQDDTGTIWATHDDGLLSMRVQGGQPVFDTTFGKINDRFPHALLLPGGDIWLVTGQSLYHLNRNFEAAPRPELNPTLVSLTNGRTNRELLPNPGLPGVPPRLPFEDNSLVFRFFAGSYATRQPPAYEFRLHQGSDSRVVLGNGSLLALSDLREGSYQLEVRLSDTRKPVGRPLTVGFVISPPWYRSWPAYGLYVLAGLGSVLGLMHWSARRSQTRNLALEKLVAERTNELRIAMRQLNEETRNAATLAERDRLAGEIHDSLQQGLSGLMLQLDATLKRADLPDDIRSRLNVARNMVSFTRQEVQHAVWDMETPLLEGTELGEALHKITALIGPGPAEVRIDVSGRPLPLPPATKHHLLRIAQEAITNAVRHAAARTIVITLAYEPAGVTLSVTDDGNGFVPNRVLSGGIGHFGLRGLRGRAAKIGGELHIESTPGHGTTVRVTVRSSSPAYAGSH